MGATAVVTGATGGIGSAIVRGLADRGYQVHGIGRSASMLESLCAEVPGVVPVVMDLSQPVELAPLLSDLDSIEVLVHCAALADVASFADAAPDTWRRTFAVNAVAAAELTAALLPALRAARGHVFFINMAPGMRAVPRWSAYVASKAALRELADSLRAEEGGNGIRVTSVYPGGTATELLRRVRDQFGRPFDPDACMQPETLAAIVIAALDCPPEAQLSELSVNAAPRG